MNEPIKLTGFCASHACLISCLLVLGQTRPVRGQEHAAPRPERHVEGNVLESAALPEIRIQVADEFDYVGMFEFTLKGLAFGERHVFVDSKNARVRRLVIVQFEGFLPNNDYTYNYDFAGADTLGGFRFRHNTWAYSNRQAQQESPGAEGPLTARFLRSRGFYLEDELMMSRFVMVPDEERRHEMILYYLENASETGHRIETFYDAQDDPTAHWIEISMGLEGRSRNSFRILD